MPIAAMMAPLKHSGLGAELHLALPLPAVQNAVAAPAAAAAAAGAQAPAAQPHAAMSWQPEQWNKRTAAQEAEHIGFWQRSRGSMQQQSTTAQRAQHGVSAQRAQHTLSVQRAQHALSLQLQQQQAHAVHSLKACPQAHGGPMQQVTEAASLPGTSAMHTAMRQGKLLRQQQQQQQQRFAGADAPSLAGSEGDGATACCAAQCAVVRVVVARTWASGIILSLKSGLVLTNAHAVPHPNGELAALQRVRVRFESEAGMHGCMLKVTASHCYCVDFQHQHRSFLVPSCPSASCM